ncbi:MAG: hypothetical protein LAN70_11530 [Acidobacteriia bacterium]|nr:hypothetical protein [Terriglobia bacterium]
MASPDFGASPPSFERISHLGELLIVIFYAEAYQQAATIFIEAYHGSGLSLGPVLVFAIFFMVTVRFFVGNHLHLTDKHWNEDLPNPQNQKPENQNHEKEKKPRWAERSSRNLYYCDAFFIALESLAMILLGGLGSVKASVNLLVGLLILISALDVVWICIQLLLNLNRRWRENRPATHLYNWLLLNVGVIIALGFPLFCSWNEPLSTRTLWEVTVINGVAFVIDIFVCNLFAA